MLWILKRVLQCWKTLDIVSRELGTTTAVITHNASIADMAHRVIYLNDGQISKIQKNKIRKSPNELSCIVIAVGYLL